MGSDRVLLRVKPETLSWTATNSADWIHLDTTSRSGTGSRTLQFNYDENPGETRTGIITVGDQALTVVQAGYHHFPAGLLIPLIKAGNGLISPRGLAVDLAGNVYVADAGANGVLEWSIASETVSPLLTGLNQPQGVAVDSSGNVYVTDTGNNAVRKWNVADGSMTNLITGSVNQPTGIAVDDDGNVFIADSADAVLWEWNSSNRSLTNRTAAGPLPAGGLALNLSGHIAVTVSNSTPAFTDWSPAHPSFGPVNPTGGMLPYSTAVDPSGNLFVSDRINKVVAILPRAFVDTSSRWEPAVGGTDTVTSVLPQSFPLQGAFAPTVDQTWLNAGSSPNGILTVSVATNLTGAVRLAFISVLGQAIPVLQLPTDYHLSPSQIAVGSTGGTTNFILTMTPIPGPWVATAQSPWIHLAAGSTSGTGPATLSFSYETNTVAERIGTLTVGSPTVGVGTQTLTIKQAAASTNGLKPHAVVTGVVLPK